MHVHVLEVVASAQMPCVNSCACCHICIIRLAKLKDWMLLSLEGGSSRQNFHREHPRGAMLMILQCCGDSVCQRYAGVYTVYPFPYVL